MSLHFFGVVSTWPHEIIIEAKCMFRSCLFVVWTMISYLSVIWLNYRMRVTMLELFQQPKGVANLSSLLLSLFHVSSNTSRIFHQKLSMHNWIYAKKMSWGWVVFFFARMLFLYSKESRWWWSWPHKHWGGKCQMDGLSVNGHEKFQEQALVWWFRYHNPCFIKDGWSKVPNYAFTLQFRISMTFFVKNAWELLEVTQEKAKRLSISLNLELGKPLFLVRISMGIC